MKRWCLFLIMLFIIFVANSQDDVDFEQIDAIFETWDQPDHPGGAIAIIKNGTVYSNGYGLASLEYNVPIDRNTIFNIASVSKQITAFSIILLEQQGKLSVDDEVRKYIPELPDFGTPITIRHLVHHISGLRNFQNLLGMAGWRQGDAMSNDDLLKYIAWQNELNFPVGSEYLYCNTGFNLMATIVERVSGKSFIEWTKENIFKPLDMDQSVFRNDMTEVVENTAQSYSGSAETGFITPKPFWDYMGNGNVYTTVGDLAKWIINFKTHQLGGEAAYAKLLQRGVLTSGDTIAYAFGISHGNYRGIKTIQHGGSIGGYRANLLYFPEQETGIVILSNFSSANPGGKSRAVADVMLSNVFTEEKPNLSNLDPKFSTTEVKINKNQLDKLAGDYLVDGLLINFSISNEDILTARVPAMGTIPLTPSSDTSFYAKAMGIHVLFHKDKMDTYNTITAYTPSREQGIRIDPKWQNPSFQSDFVGTYYSPELKTHYELSFEKQRLRVDHSRHDSFYLTPIGENELSGDFWLFSNVKVERDFNGKVTGLLVSNGRVRNLLFSKLTF